MTLQELKSLVEKMQNLPCVMSQLEEVQVSPLKRHQPISAHFLWNDASHKPL